MSAACELLGLDPLYVANEGKLICICAAAEAEKLLETMRAHPLGADAAIIGRVELREDDRLPLVMETEVGSTRPLDLLSGTDLPRIC